MANVKLLIGLSVSLLVSNTWAMDTTTQQDPAPDASSPHEYCIQEYDASRDLSAIRSILEENRDTLTYESRGYKEGTTEKYIGSPKYKTDVLRINDRTVGFINYCRYDITFLTFYFGTRGLIHLMGVNKEFQRKGFGTILLRHAISRLKDLKTPKIILSVMRDNNKARLLYEKEEFKCFMPSDLFYELNLDIPQKELPQGNIIQRNPKSFLGLCFALVASFYLK